VILMLGVNGAGKTTQTAKLAHRLGREGRKVLLAAADTFRAGASEQLTVWAERLGLPCVTGTPGGDPRPWCSMRWKRRQRAAPMWCWSTPRAGCTPNVTCWMNSKDRTRGEPTASGSAARNTAGVDGTVGQNAVQQGRGFSEAVPLTGLIITKLDGTAKGGAVVQIRRELNIPIRFIGVGEQLDDLEVFDAARFADRLLSD